MGPFGNRYLAGLLFAWPEQRVVRPIFRPTPADPRSQQMEKDFRNGILLLFRTEHYSVPHL